jgi:hypothetical protein
VIDKMVCFDAEAFDESFECVIIIEFTIVCLPPHVKQQSQAAGLVESAGGAANVE